MKIWISKSLCRNIFSNICYTVFAAFEILTACFSPDLIVGGAAVFSRSRSSLAATHSDLGQGSSSIPFPVPKSASKSDSLNNTEAISVCRFVIVKVKEYRLFVIVFDAVRRQPCRSVRETSIRLGKCRFRYIYSQLRVFLLATCYWVGNQ